MELQIFYESLMRTGNTQTILQGVMNTMKLNYDQESIGKAKQYIFKELRTLLDLKLSQVLMTMYDSETIEMAMKSNDKILAKKDGDAALDRDMEMKIASFISNHPVAMYDKQGQIQPSSLIPFCSFGAKMIGSKKPNMTFPICDIFEPTVYEGRQCYQASFEKIHGRQVLKGKKHGLMLLIDVNAERSYNIEASGEVKSADLNEVYLGKDQIVNKNPARIHIGTLAPITEEGRGDYALTSLKQMTGTENFLAWPKEKRECALEKYESCQMRGYLDKISHCGCSPFDLMSAAGFDYQV